MSDRIVPETPFIQSDAIPTGLAQPPSPWEPTDLRVVPEADTRVPASSSFTAIAIPRAEKYYYHIFGHYDEGPEFTQWINEAHREFRRRLKPGLADLVGDYTCAVYIVTTDRTYKRDDTQPVDPNQCALVLFCADKTPIYSTWSGVRMGRFPLVIDDGPVRLLADAPDNLAEAWRYPSLPAKAIQPSRPLIPGLSIGVQGSPGSASICCFLSGQRSGRRFILTGGHLSDHPLFGKPSVVQPSANDAKILKSLFSAIQNWKFDFTKPVGRLAFQHQEPIGNDWLRYFDFALIELNADVEVKNSVWGLADGKTTLQSIYMLLREHFEGEKEVHAVSRSTGYRSGEMKYMHQEGCITINGFQHHFEFPKELCVKIACAPGDSGGLIYFDSGNAFAMIWGGSKEHNVGFVVRISEILNKAREVFRLELELLEPKKIGGSKWEALWSKFRKLWNR